MEPTVKYYSIYYYDMGEYYPSDWHYQSLALAKEEAKETYDYWIINEVKIYFYDNGTVSVYEETVADWRKEK